MSFTFCLFFAQFVTTAHFSPSIDYCWGKISLRGPNDTLTKFVQYLQSIMLNKKKSMKAFFVRSISVSRPRRFSGVDVQN